MKRSQVHPYMNEFRSMNANLKLMRTRMNTICRESNNTEGLVMAEKIAEASDEFDTFVFGMEAVNRRESK